nr:hypothetical protein [Tanacetum cinerariifolium]
SAGTDLDQSAGTDLDQSAGTDLDQSAGTDLDQSEGTDLDQSAGTDLDHLSANRSRPSSQPNLANSVLRFSLDFVKSRERSDSFPGFNQRFVKSPGSESRTPMLNKENYVPWSSRLLRNAKSDANRDITVTETFHLQTDDELSDKELKQIEADDQAIQTILFGLPEDIYVAVDSCETAQEIWLRVQQMMKGSDIGIQEKKAKLFNEWKMFTSNEGESLESYYHRFLKLMNDLKRNKHFPKKIATFKLNYSTPTNNNQRNSSNPRNRQIAQPGMNMGQDRQLQMIGGIQNQIGNGNLVAVRAEGNAAGHNENQIRRKRQEASSSGTQTDSTPVYDSDGSDLAKDD